MSQSINQEHEEVLNFAHSLPSGLTKEQIYLRIHERAAKEAAARVDAAIAAHNEAVSEQERIAAELSSCRAAAAAGLPAGWKAVPIASTSEMDEAGWLAINADSAHHIDAERCWDAMLAAAPILPADPVDESQPAAPDNTWAEGNFLAAADRFLSADTEITASAVQEQTPRQRFEAWARLHPTPYDLRESKLIRNGVRTFTQDRTQWAFEAYCGALGLSALPAMEAQSHE